MKKPFKNFIKATKQSVYNLENTERGWKRRKTPHSPNQNLSGLTFILSEILGAWGPVQRRGDSSRSRVAVDALLSVFIGSGVGNPLRSVLLHDASSYRSRQFDETGAAGRVNEGVTPINSAPFIVGM